MWKECTPFTPYWCPTQGPRWWYWQYGCSSSEDLIFFFSLLTVTETVLLHREGVLCPWLMSWCSVGVEVSVHHRTFLVTERGFSMTATSVLIWSHSLAENILLWVKPTSSGHQGSLLGIRCCHLFLLRTGAAAACSVVFLLELLACINELLHKVFHGKRDDNSFGSNSVRAHMEAATWPRVREEFSFRIKVMDP